MGTATGVVTRFAPSPTGFLHIGGARTALFNWLHARHCEGRFLLRIEDTDRARSTAEATEAILEGLTWLGLAWDGEAVSQAERSERHAEVALEMLATGSAYRCYATPEEIEAFRASARAEGRPPLFRSPWRDADPRNAPDAPFVVRLRAPTTGETVVDDLVQGHITWKSETLDDLVLLRSDGTPTYMLAVVVDDHDMEISHIIRGDDHLTNAARQTLIYRGLGWEVPAFAHIPLIHGPDGAKLSKRHGALGVDAYAKMGFLPAAMRNYLARLGWSHGDSEFFTTEQAVEWFELETVGKAPARFDLKRLENLSGQHIRATDDAVLLMEIERYVALQNIEALTERQRELMMKAMPGMKERSKTIPELIEMARFILEDRPLAADEQAARLLDPVSRRMLGRLTSHLRNATWSADQLEAAVRAFAASEALSLGKVAQPLRAALTGRTISPSVFDMMAIIGREESLARIEDCVEAGVE
jgi:glutamyl-tRNA synthetase